MRDFGADAVWCEGCYPGAEASRAARAAAAPLIYRSHNLEFLYMARQARAARLTRDRLAWRLACVGLRRFEQELVHRASWVFDISL